MAKKVMYRVYAMHELVIHCGSDFEKFSNQEDAEKWAIAFGQKKGASYVILFKKDMTRYNHYIELKRISL